MGTSKKAAAAVAEDVLTEEEIAAAAEAAEAMENVEEVDVEAAVAEVEKEETKKAIHSKAKSKKATSKKATPKKAKKEAAPRMSLQTHPASEIITTRLGSDHHVLFDLDGSKKQTAANLRKTQGAVLAALDEVDKKTREKGVNLFTSLAGERRPSTYTYAATKFLKAKGEMTLKTLTDHFLEAGYAIGTARRQAGEMMVLFPIVGIGTRADERGAPVVFNDNSVLAGKILAS